jgi:hypothetical protein
VGRFHRSKDVAGINNPIASAYKVYPKNLIVYSS